MAHKKNPFENVAAPQRMEQKVVMEGDDFGAFSAEGATGGDDYGDFGAFDDEPFAAPARVGAPVSAAVCECDQAPACSANCPFNTRCPALPGVCSGCESTLMRALRRARGFDV